MTANDMLETDICVIGAGAGGLSVAAGASQMGARVVLFEGGKMGGDCLNHGCVPSKAMLAAGKKARAAADGAAFGIRKAGDPSVDFQAVHDHVHGVIGAIAPHDSVERFEGLGVAVIRDHARFTGGDTVEGGGKTVKAKRFVVATGASAFVPPIPGLSETPYLTNETIFERTERPERLIVLGGGPIGCELAQAHRHLGGDVTVLEMFSIMPKDDPELVDVVRGALIADGIALLEGAKATQVSKSENGVAVAYEKDGLTGTVEGTHLLVAAGRAANVSGLNLEAADIAYSSKGIEVDARLRTSNKKVFAIGDVAGEYQFTHVAGHHAGVVIRNALFRIPAKVDYSALPWATFTEPELAHVGMTERIARDRHGDDIDILRWSFAENDRAQAERETDGMVKVVTRGNGRILGASIAGPMAGELIHPWVLAIGQGMKIGAMASMIAPYPTLGEVNKRAAGSYYAPRLFSDRTRSIVRFLLRFA